MFVCATMCAYNNEQQQQNDALTQKEPRGYNGSENKADNSTISNSTIFTLKK